MGSTNSLHQVLIVGISPRLVRPPVLHVLAGIDVVGSLDHQGHNLVKKRKGIGSGNFEVSTLLCDEMY